MFVSPPIRPAHRKVFEGVASRHEMYALFNRHAQAPFDDNRMNGTHYVGEWFEITEADHDHMFEILPPLFYRGDMFAMREFLAASVTDVPPVRTPGWHTTFPTPQWQDLHHARSGYPLC